jgi:hypothetical protein
MWRSNAVIVAALAGCTGATSSDGLEPAGPPEILQVLVRERADGELVNRLAHGDHPDIGDEDDREVSAAVARDGQRIRVVFDELLRGNFLEEVPCADGSWSRVPVGADFDDVAACAGADLSRCRGICIGPDGPIGILDENGDGAFDDTRLIEGAATITCDGEPVVVDPQRSYYQPSGSQRLDTGSVGTDSLGPAVVIAPASGMRPGATCTIGFAAEVVDKQGERVGDTGDISFQVEPFVVHQSQPADGAEDVELTDPDSSDAVIAILLNAALDPGELAGRIAITAGGVDLDDLETMVSPDDDATVLIPIAGGFAPATTYAVAISGVLDIYGDVVPDTTITFTTRSE